MRTQIALAVLSSCASLASTPVFAAEPSDEMRMFARMFATLEARDVKGYCEAMHRPAYADYLSRVCQSAVQNRMKKPEDCSQQSIAQQVKLDAGKCLAMPAAEFEKTALRGIDGSRIFVKEMATQGVDGERLIKEERAKLR